MTVKLQPGKKYRRWDGREVTVTSLAYCPMIDGQAVYMTREGDWFAEDGRFVLPPALVTTDPIRGRSLAPHDSWHNITEEIKRKAKAVDA